MYDAHTAEPKWPQVCAGVSPEMKLQCGCIIQHTGEFKKLFSEDTVWTLQPGFFFLRMKMSFQCRHMQALYSVLSGLWRHALSVKQVIRRRKSGDVIPLLHEDVRHDRIKNRVNNMMIFRNSSFLVWFFRKNRWKKKKDDKKEGRKEQMERRKRRQ